MQRRSLFLVLALAVAACGGDGDDAPTVAPKTLTYFVAAEPVDWNYAPLGSDPAFNQPLPEPWGPTLVYPKLRYVQYTDDSFTTPVDAPAWAGILGPQLRAAVGDTLEVVFFNRTDRPLSMHPHGVKYAPRSEGAEYEPDGSARGIAAPGERVTYTWIADENAGPTPEEPSSKVWLYHSHVVADEEIYRGLIGTIVVTDNHRAKEDRTPADVDRELTALFMVWNENAENTPEEEQEGNLKHAINGEFFANLQGLEMNQGEHVRWYMIALGTEVDLHTAHWHGETVVTESGSHTDVLELLPASMRVVDMFPDNPGTWLLHCHVADHMIAGMYATYSIR
jgi:FtsP/CotA-like multicopper oxidase with cupredoxin domain